MKINLQAKNMEITEAIHNYIGKKVTNLGRVLSQIEEEGGEVQVHFNIAKTTNHHKAGDVFHADCSIHVKDKDFYSSAEKEDLYEAIDVVKENLFGEISKNKDKKNRLFYRGARKIKDMLKGIKSWKK